MNRKGRPRERSERRGGLGGRSAPQSRRIWKFWLFKMTFSFEIHSIFNLFDDLWLSAKVQIENCEYPEAKDKIYKSSTVFFWEWTIVTKFSIRICSISVDDTRSTLSCQYQQYVALWLAISFLLTLYMDGMWVPKSSRPSEFLSVEISFQISQKVSGENSSQG